MTYLKTVDALLQEFKHQRPIRAGSLIISIFGDSISQHGGSVWLGSLIGALEPFGLNQRLVRTSVYRLIQDGWLKATQVGRRSYYSFTEYGLRHYEKSAQRVYAAAKPPWCGHWTLVLPTFVVDEEREKLRKQLRWLGFGTLASGLLARPGTERRTLDETLQELGLSDKVVVMNACTEDVVAGGVMKKLAASCWNLSELESRYNLFLQRFRPALNDVVKIKSAASGRAMQQRSFQDPLLQEKCFQLRTLLIHEYRRILLNDTDLPDELLPVGWVGQAAMNLTANIYRATYRGAEQYLLAAMETAEGALPAANKDFYARFGGLEQSKVQSKVKKAINNRKRK